MCPTKFSVQCPAKSLGNFVISDKIAENLPKSDVAIVTSTGLRIPAHSHILAMVSPVMENVIEKAKRNPKTGDKVISIPGVPSEAVSSFVQFLYSSRRSYLWVHWYFERTTKLFRRLWLDWQSLWDECHLIETRLHALFCALSFLIERGSFQQQPSCCTDEEIDKYGMHLLALSHVFSVPKLKQRCTKGLAIGLTIENVIDVLQLARLCDAPDLHLKGMKLVSGKFRDVKKTEGWRFVRKNDPWLELDVLQYIDEVESRKKRTKRQKEEQRQYLQLSEAMDCLVHICTEGCTSVGPYDMDPNKKKEPCKRFATCHGLQMLIRHFATCKKRVNGGCSRCKRMWQLLRLHASMCEHHDHCKVPLCRQFKMKMQQREKKADDAKWRVLVKKVLQAKTVSSLSLRNEAAAPHQVTKPSCDGSPLHGCNSGA